MSFKNDPLEEISEPEEEVAEAVESLEIEDDEAELAAEYGAGARISASATNVVGAHANLASILARLVNMSLCARGNHKWVRDPRQGIRKVRNKKNQLVWKGQVMQICTYCQTSITFTSGEAITPDELIPTQVINESVKELKDLANTMESLYNEMVDSELYSKYIAEYWDLYQSNAAGIEKTRGAILAIMKSVKAIGSKAANEVDTAFDKFKAEYRKQKKLKPKAGPARPKFKEAAKEIEQDEE